MGGRRPRPKRGRPPFCLILRDCCEARKRVASHEKAVSMLAPVRHAVVRTGVGRRWLAAGVGTVSVKGGEPRRASGHMKSSDAIVVPIVQTAAYTFKDSQELIDFNEGRHASFEYGRYGNPTVRAVEQKMMELEGAEDCLASASGMYTAVSMMMALLPPGSRVITTTDCYRRTRQFLNTVIDKMGVQNVVIPPGDLDALEREVKGGAAMFFSESPSNPMLRCVDIPAAAEICRSAGTILCIDGTFSTPYNQRPLDLGADIVIHSATKYLAGHHDVLAGVLCGRKEVVDIVRNLHGVMGGVLDPHAAYLLLRGLKTLHLRVARQNASAEALARLLQAHPKVLAAAPSPCWRALCAARLASRCGGWLAASRARALTPLPRPALPPGPPSR